MDAVFLKLLNMSITASWLVVAVVLLRLLLKKAPKIISLIMWALVGVRLILPISLESVFSLIPSAQTFPSDFTTSTAPIIHSGISIFDSNINPIISQSLTPNVGDSVTPIQVITFIASVVWLAGVAAMLLYALVSYIRLRLKVREAVKSEGNIMLCDNIASPFILGLIRPKIYIPSSVAEQDMYYVLAHENAHLKRRDHFWKPLGFLLLSVYWFNPVLWVAYILLCRDIELACDEKVIKSLGIEAKKPYSTALVNCSVSRKAITVCPLAFGEVGVKKRVKTVLNYKKPAFWIIIIALILCIVVAICFLTIRPADNGDTTTTTTTPSTTTTTVPHNNSTTTVPNNNSTTTTTTNNANTTTTNPNATNLYGDMKMLNKVHYYDIDGERGQEFCMIIPVEDAPHDLFRIIVVGGYETIPKYYAIYNCGDMHSHSFAEKPDGTVGIVGINNDPSDTKTRFWDISIENGRIVLKEDGKLIAPYDLGPEPLYGSTVNLSNFYFDSRNSKSFQLRGDYRTSEETIALGYMKYAASESEAPQTYWVLAVIDYDNPELTTYISLGAHEYLNFFMHGYGWKYGELPKDAIFIEDAEADQLYAQILYQDGGYTLVHEIG